MLNFNKWAPGKAGQPLITLSFFSIVDTESAMKTFIVFLSFGIFLLPATAQVSKVPVYRTDIESKIRTVKLDPRTELTLRVLISRSDTARKDFTYSGLFHSAPGDSIGLRLKSERMFQFFPSGISRTTTTMLPQKSGEGDTASPELKMVAFDNIAWLKYQKRPELIRFADQVLEPVVFSSLFVLMLSPFISYNYRDGYLNTETYKNWALGSTIALASCFSVLITINAVNRAEYQFRDGWPEKKAKVWSFKPAIRK